jgi:hypothetical protein
MEHVYEKLVELLVAEGTFASEKLRLTEASIAHAAFSPRSASSDCWSRWYDLELMTEALNSPERVPRPPQ